MIFLNPWAWLGLTALAAPVVAHLLARRPARRQPFPNLRFLPPAALTPIRRGRLTDIALLLLRGAIIAAGVVALTRPVWLSPDRARDLGDQIARAIVVDAGASMSRTAAAGGRALDAARREAAGAAAGATRARIGESPAPARALAGAVAWLATQPLRREVVVVSDFQPAALARADLAAVPADIGVRLIAIPIDRAAPAPAGADARADAGGQVLLLAGAAERAGALAARSAALDAGAPALGRADRPIAIVFPAFDGRAALLASAQPIDQPWMFDAAMVVATDPTLVAARERAGSIETPAMTTAHGVVDGVDRLLIVTSAPAPSLQSAALIGGVLRAAADSAPASEADQTARSSDELRAWERPAAAVAPSGSQAIDQPSDGRWWWAAALLFLIMETVVRRRPISPPAIEESRHARVA